jgi:glycosyltransferase involved in cell wall biosynthesis
VLERLTPAWEVVFVDDGSHDDTAAVVAAHHAPAPA